ncbi:hypothetical protein [Salisaeta longa]|uniref:hypothetical protein n=1 Tax=Salisaeta longa TaxID=503170 RepID=UPI0003B33912|nr:hypothetical protein [Salisaeta longa]
MRYLSLLLVVGLCWAAPVCAQHRTLSLEASYPLPIGNTFLSQYDGVVGGSVTMGQPIGGRFALRLGLQYNRLHWDRAGTNANIYTPRVGLAYQWKVSDRIAIIPAVGGSYTRFVFVNDVVRPEKYVATLNGGGFWVGLTPQYRVNDRWALGLAMEYRATFMERSDTSINTQYNEQYHALVFGIVGTYTF